MEVRTPHSLAIARRDGFEGEEYEYPTLLDKEFYKEVSNLKAIAALLDPKDDMQRRKVIEEAVYKELMSKIPGVNQMPK